MDRSYVYMQRLVSYSQSPVSVFYVSTVTRSCAYRIHTVQIAPLFLYCYERDFMDSLNHDNQADDLEAFNSTSRYLDDLWNIDNPYFEGMARQTNLSP